MARATKYLLTVAMALLRAISPGLAFLLPPLSTALHRTSPPSTVGKCRTCHCSTHIILSSSVSTQVDTSTSTIETSTLRAPLRGYNQHPRDGDDNTRRQRYRIGFDWEEHGLLCLERALPENILDGLDFLAAEATPFKKQVVCRRGWLDADDRSWVERLTMLLLPSLTSEEPRLAMPDVMESSPPLEATRRDPVRSTDSVHLPQQHKQSNEHRLVPSRELSGAPSMMTDGGIPKLVRSQSRKDCGVKAWHWLKQDIELAVVLFAEEASRHSTDASFTRAGLRAAGGGGSVPDAAGVDLTVKLELLEEGKCPRFHLDKVPLRLICTYVGPSTEWVDGYDRREMEQNRSLPPVCNERISGGREAQNARAGSLLLFRGQLRSNTDMRPVAHRSPHVLEGQRRLILTVDVGEIVT